MKFTMTGTVQSPLPSVALKAVMREKAILTLILYLSMHLMLFNCGLLLLALIRVQQTAHRLRTFWAGPVPRVLALTWEPMKALWLRKTWLPSPFDASPKLQGEQNRPREVAVFFWEKLLNCRLTATMVQHSLIGQVISAEMKTRSPFSWTVIKPLRLISIQLSIT